MRLLILAISFFTTIFGWAASDDMLSNAIERHGKTLSSVLEQFRLDPNNEYSDGPYYDDASPSPDIDKKEPHSKSVQVYNNLIKSSQGSYLLFGQGNNILQLLLTKHKVYALQLNCAMYCSLSSEPDETYQVFVIQNDRKTPLKYNLPLQILRKQYMSYAAAMPMRIAVNLGDKAAGDKKWQIIQLAFDPVEEEYHLYYWRQDKL